MKPGSAVVVGGSLGGLIAANLLHQAGWDVTLYEKAKGGLAGRGAGLVAHPELFRILGLAGIDVDAIEGLGVPVTRRIALDQAGRIVGELACPQMLTSWNRLYDALDGIFPRERHLSGMAVAGVPIDGDVLRSAGIEACDAVAAVTKDDNINLMVAQIARELFGVKHVIARVAEPSRKEVYTERFGLRIVCGTNLTAQGLLAGILQEEDDEDQCVMFGSSTANFSAVPAAKHQWNRPLSSVQPPRAGMMVFGVLRANGTMELANTQPTLHVDDKILFAELAD